jgi:hypothetical protein
MRHRFLLLLLISGLAASGAAGQGTVGSVAIDSGTLVRLTPRAGSPFEGRLIQRFPAASTTLSMCRYPGPPCTDPSDSTAIRKAQVASLLRLEVQRGNHAGSGALLGGGIGALLGVVAGSFARGLCDTADCASGANTAPLSGAFVGAAIGALFGWASPRWGQP